MTNLLGPAKARDIPSSDGVDSTPLRTVSCLRTFSCFDFSATFRTEPLMSKAGGDENSARGYSGHEVTSGDATDASIILMGGWLNGARSWA